jgi:hypothetical protein
VSVPPVFGCVSLGQGFTLYGFAECGERTAAVTWQGQRDLVTPANRKFIGSTKLVALDAFHHEGIDAGKSRKYRVWSRRGTRLVTNREALLTPVKFAAQRTPRREYGTLGAKTPCMREIPV